MAEDIQVLDIAKIGLDSATPSAADSLTAGLEILTAFEAT